VTTPAPYDVPAFYAQTLGMQLRSPTLEYNVADVWLSHEDYFPGTTLYTVARDDVPLAVVKRITLEFPATVFLGPPWTALRPEHGRIDVSGDGAMVALTVDSPRDQTVPFYWGYAGKAQVAVNPGGRVYLLQPLAPPSEPAFVRTKVDLRAGHNAVLIDLADIDRGQGLFVHYPSDLELRQGPPPPRR